IYNLGTGTGYSVLQMVQAMEKASGREVRAELQGHRQLLPQTPDPPEQPWHHSLSPSGIPEPMVLLSLQIKYQITARREGDVASCYADPTLAEQELGWKAAFGLDKMCEDLWRWQLQNPTGFSKN
ncbi:UDP-glucose 4-epimerase, partial [Lamprotornis superbus]